MASLASSQRLLFSRCRQQALRAARRSSSGRRAIATASAEDVQDWKDSGIVCERNLITFKTLHDIQVNSCEVFENNRLFGTYSEASKDFEWMTFGEFGDKVDQCRAVLKDLGEFNYLVEKDCYGCQVCKVYLYLIGSLLLCCVS